MFMKPITPQSLNQYGFKQVHATDVVGTIYAKGGFTVTEMDGKFVWSTPDSQGSHEIETISGLRMAYEEKIGERLMRSYKSEMRT